MPTPELKNLILMPSKEAITAVTTSTVVAASQTPAGRQGLSFDFGKNGTCKPSASIFPKVNEASLCCLCWTIIQPGACAPAQPSL
jgi:hypothetical protein